jgi:DNA-binding response OmpR family regulator
MPSPRPVLLVDDDDVLRESLVEHLVVEGGCVVTEASSIQEAEARLSANDARFDAIILDVRLPDGDGRELYARLRRRGMRMPIILLTEAAAAVAAPRIDVEDEEFLVKPIKVAVLLARLRTLFRIFENSEHAVLTIGPYTFRAATKWLHETATNRRIHLTEKEAAILKFLYRAGGQSATHQVLLDEIWGYSPKATIHSLETHIYRLRQKIEPDPANARLVVTVRGGYRLARWIPPADDSREQTVGVDLPLELQFIPLAFPCGSAGAPIGARCGGSGSPVQGLCRWRWLQRVDRSLSRYPIAPE